MPSKLGHLVKFVPALISGTYVTYPTFLPTMPKDIEELLSERDCYVAAEEKDTTNKQLLACVTKIGKYLYFFFHDSSSSFAIPVKYLKFENGDTGGGRRK